MKRLLQHLMICSLLAFPLQLFAQQPAPPSSPPAQPAPAPTPVPTATPTSAAPSPSPAAGTPTSTATPSNTAGTSKTDIPVISIGDQVKPMAVEKENNTNTGKNPSPKRVVRRSTPRTAKVDTNIPLFLESQQLIHSRISQIGDEVIFIVAENYPPKGRALLPKGTLVVGKISAIQRMEKDQAAGIRVNLESVISPSGSAIPISGTWEVIRQKDQDNWGGKEAFVTVGTRQAANITKRFSTRVASKSTKSKTVKGQLSAPAEIEKGSIEIKLGALRYPTRIEASVEGPQGTDGTNIKEDSIRIVRINDFVLPVPLSPMDDKIKVADRNKNKVKDVGYKFTGWDLIRYLPAGNSIIVMTAQTQDGKPVEVIATVNTEYK